MHDQRWPRGFQSSSHQATDLAIINILFFLLPSNPLSFSQYGRELHLAWKGCNDDPAFHYQLQATTLGDVFFSIDIFITDHKLRMFSCPNGTPDQTLKSHQIWLLTADASKNTLGMKATRPRFDRCQKTVQIGTHQRRQRYPKTPQACLSSLTPITFCAQCWKGKEVASV